jgi:hypothetical protein
MAFYSKLGQIIALKLSADILRKGEKKWRNVLINMFLHGSDVSCSERLEWTGS